MKTGFFLQQAVGLEGQVIAFALLLANVQQPHSGLGDLEHITAVDVAEQGELVQVGGFAIHVGAHIQHQHRLSWVLGGEQGPDRWSLDARQTAQSENGGGHHRSGVACGVHGQGLPFFDQVHGHIDAGVPLAAHHSGFFVHLHRGATGDQVEIASFDGLIEGLCELHLLGSSAHAVGFSDEADAKRQAGNGLKTSLEDRARSMVSAHAIHGDPEAVGIVDGGVAVGLTALKAAQGVEHQRLQHGAGHGTSARHHCAGDAARNRACG